MRDVTLEVSEVDLWRAAQLLVQGYGDVAEQEAAQRADECFECAEDEESELTALVWELVAERVRDLKSGKPGIYLH